MSVEIDLEDRSLDFDAVRDADRHTSRCGACGSPDPARVGDGGCSDCREYPRCWLCRRWVGDGPGLADYRLVRDERGADCLVCETCWEKVA